MSLSEFFSSNPKIWWLISFIVGLIFARKPMLRFFRSRLDRNASKMEIDHFEILREEIGDLNKLLLKEQAETRRCHEENGKLLLEIQQLKLQVTELSKAIKNMG